MTDGSEYALMTFDANLHFVHALGQANVYRQPDGLGSVINENGADGHGGLLGEKYMAPV